MFQSEEPADPADKYCPSLILQQRDLKPSRPAPGANELSQMTTFSELAEGAVSDLSIDAGDMVGRKRSRHSVHRYSFVDGLVRARTSPTTISCAESACCLFHSDRFPTDSDTFGVHLFASPLTLSLFRPLF
ncbi:unnamed protein product [Protopolystoma xenopodis]|uniref:Uncharacterized protein n=1 Tax=Protopolystoma xenopodis TaxID=117903 RepID=A0A448WYC1_9PLAT|nr:unnamed protein product [Protopolystoma xenopodis]